MWKIGDTVRCVDSAGCDYLTTGNAYIIEGFSDNREDITIMSDNDTEENYEIGSFRFVSRSGAIVRNLPSWF